MTAVNALPVILMLEHDDDDRFLTSHVFEEQQLNIRLEFVPNREEVFNYLQRCTDQNRPLPALILINLHMSPVDGREVLKQLKTDDRYRHIPVVMLSGGKEAAMVRECYALGASSFIQKPAHLHETNEKIASFFKYWFTTVELT